MPGDDPGAGSGDHLGWVRSGRPSVTLSGMGNKGTCKADSCEKPVVGKGYCKRCYRLWKRGEMPKPRRKKVIEHNKPKATEGAEAPAAEATEAPAAEGETPAES